MSCKQNEWSLIDQLIYNAYDKIAINCMPRQPQKTNGEANTTP